MTHETLEGRRKREEEKKERKRNDGYNDIITRNKRREKREDRFSCFEKRGLRKGNFPAAHDEAEQVSGGFEEDGFHGNERQKEGTETWLLSPC